MKKILLVHQNFPGQYKHLAPALAARGDQVVALTINPAPAMAGVQTFRYGLTRGASSAIHPLIAEQEVKVIRGESCARAARALREQGFVPDIICAHPGWGEALFLKDVFPEAAILLFHEFFYHARGFDVGFDPEFPAQGLESDQRLRMKNAHLLLSFNAADALVTPTYFQRDTLPIWAHPITEVIHDGIDTQNLQPDPTVSLTIDGKQLRYGDPIVTFVNRNLEPYRGYHQFMRALPLLQQQCPEAQIVIVGGEDVSYGSRPPAGKTWKQIFLEEVESKLDLSRIHFVGTLAYPQFITLLRLSAAHVYLTYPFVLSWSLIESMSLQCPIIASDTAPVREAIRHGENGLLVDFFQPRQLADAIALLLNQPEYGRQLGAQARKTAVANYDLKTVCLPQHLALIDRLIDMKKVR